MPNANDNQTVAYQFTATAFDGMTPAPPAVLTADEDQFYVAEQPSMGLFPVNDPSQIDFSTGRGNRWLTWIEVRLNAPAPAGSKIEVVDNSSVDGSLAVLKEVRDYSGESLVYIETGILVPQGAVLRLTGGAGILRYHVTFLDPQSLAIAASLVLSAQANEGSDCCLDFSEEVATAAGNVQLELGVQQRYDANALAPNAMVLVLPPSPAKDDRCGIIEVGDSTATVQLNGNGQNVATPSSPGAPIVSTGIARQSLIWQFDGDGTWRPV